MTKKLPFAVFSSLALTAAAVTMPVSPLTVTAATENPIEVANGFYFGGSANFYISIADLGKLSTKQVNDLVVSAGGLKNINVVIGGEYASIQQTIDAKKTGGSYYSIQKPVDSALFEGQNYKDKNGVEIPVPDAFQATTFEVTDISAVTKDSITVSGIDATPSGPSAEHFNVTVDGVKVEVLDVYGEDGTYTLSVDLDGKKGVLSVNGFKTDFNMVTTLSVVVNDNEALTIAGASRSTVADVLDIDSVEGLIKLLPDFSSGVTLNQAFLENVKEAIKEGFYERTGKTIRQVTLADVADKTITVSISGAEIDSPESEFTFTISFKEVKNN